jgi:hypothetical protein
MDQPIARRLAAIGDVVAPALSEKRLRTTSEAVARLVDAAPRRSVVARELLVVLAQRLLGLVDLVLVAVVLLAALRALSLDRLAGAAQRLLRVDLSAAL